MISEKVVYVMGVPLIFIVLVVLLTVYDLFRNILHVAKLIRDGWMTIC